MFKINPINYYLKKGFKNLKKGKLLKARDNYIKALAIEPADISILNNLAQINSMIGDYGKAKGYNEILLNECNKQLNYEKTEELLVVKLNALTMLGKKYEINDTADQLLEINPNNIIGLMHKTQYLELNNKPKEALTYIEKILKIDKNNIPLILSKGRNLVELNEFEQAEECYNYVFKLDYKNKTAMHLKSQLLKKKNRTDITPHDLMLKAMTYWEKKELKKADEYFIQALNLNSKYDEIWFLRGVLLMMRNDIDESVKCFKNAFEINPNSGGAEKKKILRLLKHIQRINNLRRKSKK